MVDRNIVNKLGLSEEEIEQQVNEMFTEKEGEFLEEALQKKVDAHLPGVILKGMIVSQIGNDVIVEIGLKSEGFVDAGEFDSSDEIEPGREIEVLLEDTDSSGGLIPLSKRKADRIRGWETIVATKKEGDVVTGKVVRRIKGGLLVDIGVPVFLPASQVDIRRPGDISRFIGKDVECKILKIDVDGHNIVVSRRKLIEEDRRSSKEKILREIEAGQLRKGIVKNIADFGVFVDLGGLDGLLHISDLSWGRISHPSEVLALDQEIECVVIGVDKEGEKISLGLKQKTSSPWENVEETYPIGSRIKGKVVNVMNYGVFVRLENGIEGLVHISEMSWTRRLNHPSEILNLGDEIEVAVLNVNRDKQEISLGLKQTETNPWTIASQKYPVGTIVAATVHSVTNFGVFVEIEEGIDGMIHISDLSWTRKYSHPSEAVQKGKEIRCVVLEVNEEKQRISLGMKQMTEDPWIRAIPEKYVPGHIIKGVVTKLTNFGAFVELESELEGLLHISELADHKIEKPQDVVKEGEEIEVKILRVDIEARKIGLSLRRAQWAAEEQGKGDAGAAEEAAQKEKPAPVETVLSDSDIETVMKQQEDAGESREDAASSDEKHEPAETDIVAPEIEPGGSVEKIETEVAKAGEETAAAEAATEETEETEVSGDEAKGSEAESKKGKASAKDSSKQGQETTEVAEAGEEAAAAEVATELTEETEVSGDEAKGSKAKSKKGKASAKDSSEQGEETTESTSETSEETDTEDTGESVRK